MSDIDELIDNINRYEFAQHTRGMGIYHSMDKCTDGEWVAFEDCEKIVAEVRRQRDEIAKLRDALEPFAMKVNDGWNDNDVFHITSNPTLTGPTITAGNVRAAAKALEETK